MFAISGAAFAAPTAYTNLTAWQAAAGTSGVETFGSSTVGDFASPAFGPLAFNGFSISGTTSGEFLGIHTGAVGSGGVNTPLPASFAGQNFVSWGNGTGVDSGNAGPTITLTFSTPTTAFGFDWFNTDQTDLNQIISLPDGTVFANPPFTSAGTSAAVGFFGVVSSTPISAFTISTQSYGGYVSDEGFDNVRVAGTPEPATLSLLACGAAVLLRRARRA